MTGIRVTMGMAVFLALWSALPSFAADPAPRAFDNEPRIWRALSGDMLELDGRIMRLENVRCPDQESEKGRAAKALLNTFLRGGDISCQVRQTVNGPLATCSKEGRDIATGMLRSGLCRPHVSLPEREAGHMTEKADSFRLGSARRDRRQYLDNLCNPRSKGISPSVAFSNRCPLEALRRSRFHLVWPQ